MDDDNYIAQLAKDHTLAPLGDKVLVRPHDLEKRTKGGLVIPDSAKRHTLSGEVLSVGPGRYSESGVLIPMTVRAGQDVVYNRYAGTHIKTDKETVLFMSIDDVQGVIFKQGDPEF